MIRVLAWGFPEARNQTACSISCPYDLVVGGAVQISLEINGDRDLASNLQPLSRFLFDAVQQTCRERPQANRAGSKLPAKQKRTFEKSQAELRKLFET